MAIDRDAVIEFEHSLIEGIRKSDIPFLDGILHDDLLFLAPNGQVVTKQMDFRRFAWDSRMISETVVDVMVRFSPDSWFAMSVTECPL